jgi:glutamine synthetase
VRKRDRSFLDCSTTPRERHLRPTICSWASAGWPSSICAVSSYTSASTSIRGACAFSTPTVNGYKRYRPYSLAPDRLIWGKENRGALLRVVGGPGDPGTRIENRIGEPAANPYLYFASQIYSGLDGMAQRSPLPPSADTPYEAKADFLPHTLTEALDALRNDRVLREGFGDTFVDYYVRMKEAEVARYNLEVSDWEHREYFDLF